MNHWQAGDPCIVVCPVSLVNGQRTTIRRVGVVGHHRGRSFIGCEVDIQHSALKDFDFAIFENHELIPIPDDDNKEEYDGRQVTIWELCPPEVHPSRFPEKVTV